MFVMLFIYVAPFNYSFVYLFMEELTEIGKFIFAEGHLASLYPPPTQRERRGRHIRLVSNCFMWCFHRLIVGCHFHPSRQVSRERRSESGCSEGEGGRGEKEDETVILSFPSKLAVRLR